MRWFGRANAWSVSAMVVVAALGGCASGPYDGRFFYEPRPADVRIRFVDEQTTENARALVVVRGVRRADAETGEQPSVEVLWQVSNEGERPLMMRANSLRLTAANLEAFPPPRTDPPDDVEVPPGEAKTIQARFPFPGGEYPGSFDLSGLNVQWAVESDGRAASESTTFRRREVTYYPSYAYWGPYDPYPYSYYGGYVRYRYYWCY